MTTLVGGILQYPLVPCDVNHFFCETDCKIFNNEKPTIYNYKPLNNVYLVSLYVWSN